MLTIPRPPFDCIALLLQGGGALGAYQGGVAEALFEAGIKPDWIGGISIGAVNAAILAGNPPAVALEKLRGFWEFITESPLWNDVSVIEKTADPYGRAGPPVSGVRQTPGWR